MYFFSKEVLELQIHLIVSALNSYILVKSVEILGLLFLPCYGSSKYMYLFVHHFNKREMC